jgi:cell division protein FtsQ
MMRRRGQTATRNRRREQSRPWLRNRLQRLRRFGPAALVVLGLVGAVLVLRLSLDKPVERVAISGRFQRVQPLEVEKAVRGAVASEGMVSVDLAQIAYAVEQIPWVDRASVARNWPRALTVQVVEQAPVARWGEGGLVNLRGEVFVHDSRHMPPELAELVGPDGQQGLMTERYLAAAPRLTQAGMRLTRVTLDARGAWELTLDNGVTLRLGREHVDERFERFMRAASRIVATRAVEISYVDLRYANGFAVGWRAGSEGARRG